MIKFLTLLLATTFNPVLPIPPSDFHIHSTVNYTYNLTNDQMDSLWGFSNGHPEMHNQSQDTLHRISGWQEQSDWKGIIETIALESDYIDSVSATNAATDMQVAVNNNGWSEATSPTALSDVPNVSAYYIKNPAAGVYVYAVSFHSGTSEVEAAFAAPLGKPGYMQEAKSSLMKQLNDVWTLLNAGNV